MMTESQWDRVFVEHVGLMRRGKSGDGTWQSKIRLRILEIYEEHGIYMIRSSYLKEINYIIVPSFSILCDMI